MEFLKIFLQTHIIICLYILFFFYGGCVFIFSVLCPIILRIYFLFKRPNTNNSISLWKNDWEYGVELSINAFFKFHSFLLKKVKVPFLAIYIIINGVFLILAFNNKIDFLDYETFILSFFKGLF
tara:strand:- start:61 stop:432 length:372 start_codon:yes stop_codon:yes gene_type:complete